jgi:hypothetical protein
MKYKINVIYNMDGQDWKPVVFKKTGIFKTNTVESKQNNNSGISRANYENDEKIEEQAKKKVQLNDKLSMAKHRTLCGYKNQKALAEATRGKISVARINELESGKGKFPTGTEKQILFKLIKMKFS